MVRGCNMDKFNGSIESSQKCCSCFLKINCPTFNLNVRRWMIFNQPAVNFLFTGRKQIVKYFSWSQINVSVSSQDHLDRCPDYDITSIDPQSSQENYDSYIITLHTVLLLPVLVHCTECQVQPRYISKLSNLYKCNNRCITFYVVTFLITQYKINIITMFVFVKKLPPPEP